MKKTGLEHCAVAAFKYEHATVHNIAKCFSVLPEDSHVTAARDNSQNNTIEFLIHSNSFPESVIDAQRPQFPLIAFNLPSGYSVLSNGKPAGLAN